jgi:hypothetical protein
MQDHLKRHLLSVLLTALAYNPNATLTFLNHRNLVDEFFKQLLQDKMCEGFTNSYEQKTFIIGLSSALNAGIQLPPAMIGHMLKIVQEIIRMLGRLKTQEAKALKKAAKQEINQNAEDDDEDEDENYEDEGESGEDEDDEAEDDNTMEDGNHGQKNKL